MLFISYQWTTFTLTRPHTLVVVKAYVKATNAIFTVRTTVYTSAEEASWHTVSGRPITTDFPCFCLTNQSRLTEKNGFRVTESFIKPFNTLWENRWCCNVYNEKLNFVFCIVFAFKPTVVDLQKLN